MAEFVKILVTNEAAATAWILEEPPSSTAFEHSGGMKKKGGVRVSHDNKDDPTQTCYRALPESPHNSASYQDKPPKEDQQVHQKKSTKQ